MAFGTPSPRRPAERLRFRRNVDRLTPRQLAILRRAFDRVMALRDDRGYGRWAGEHGLPFPTECDFAHRRPYFLTWHRAYLWRFERALRDQEPEAMLGWWDWRTGRIPPAFSQARVDDQPNPLFAAQINPVAVDQAAQAGRPVAPVTQRQPGRPGTRLPTAQQVSALLELSDFTSFNNELENLHDSVHVWVGGHMSQIGFSSYDPIFWAHHAMVDRLWRIWQLRHPGLTPPAAIIPTATGFGLTVAQVLDTTSLGYDYASSTSRPMPS